MDQAGTEGFAGAADGGVGVVESGIDASCRESRGVADKEASDLSDGDNGVFDVVVAGVFIDPIEKDSGVGTAEVYAEDDVVEAGGGVLSCRLFVGVAAGDDVDVAAAALVDVLPDLLLFVKASSHSCQCESSK